MQSLREIISDANKKKIALGHFNVSDIAGLKAVFEAARELNLPVIVGASEGEREFIGVKTIACAVRNLRESYNHPIFLNADHTHSFEKAKEAIDAGFDAVLFDGGNLTLDENIKETKRVVDFVKSARVDVVVEGELGYIGGSSSMLDAVSINTEDLASPDDAEAFVKETGVDILGPAVGNIHGMLKNSSNPSLDIERIRAIREKSGVPIVLHGGSGIRDDDFIRAISAGVAIIHINTEIRIAWRNGIEKAFSSYPGETTPYKLLPVAIEEMKRVIKSRMKLFAAQQ